MHGKGAQYRLRLGLSINIKLHKQDFQCECMYVNVIMERERKIYRVGVVMMKTYKFQNMRRSRVMKTFIGPCTTMSHRSVQTVSEIRGIHVSSDQVKLMDGGADKNCLQDLVDENKSLD